MKRVFIGGFISLIGSIWALAIAVLAMNNLTSSWATPPGRFLTTISQLDMTPWFVVSIVFVAAGVAVMVVEYFKKDN